MEKTVIESRMEKAAIESLINKWSGELQRLMDKLEQMSMQTDKETYTLLSTQALCLSLSINEATTLLLNLAELQTYREHTVRQEQAALLEIVNIYAGMEGVVIKTELEGYLQKVIEDMYSAALEPSDINHH